MKIYIGNDHAAPAEKLKLVEFLTSKGHQVDDCGIAEQEKADYPDIAQVVAQKVLADNGSLGILICGTGVGMSIKANRNIRIRAALLYDDFTAVAAKEHNNANIICFGARTMSVENIINRTELFLNAEFSGLTEAGIRHAKRIEKLDK